MDAREAAAMFERRIVAALALHVRLTWDGCTCGHPYPCATRRALEGDA